jgi:MFS family permease
MTENATETSSLLVKSNQQEISIHVVHQVDRRNDNVDHTVRNFYRMAALFSANHGCAVAGLSLATARLGAIGAWQSGVLSFSYMASAVLGATYIVKRFGGRIAMATGMFLYCIYVGCFWVALQFPEFEKPVALSGAAIGGLGAGLLWTAQGSYMAQAAKRHAKESFQDVNVVTTSLAGGFAFVYLTSEVCLRFMSTALAGFLNWQNIFVVYTFIALSAAFGMLFVTDYGRDQEDSTNSTTLFYKLTAGLQLLVSSRKMKYMIGLNAAFGFASAFLNSYINGEVLKVALNDDKSVYVGALTSWIAVSAAVMSLLLRKIPDTGAILVGGAIAFFFVAFPFILYPDASQWTVPGLLVIYTLHGIGRSTFESTLRSTFVEFFPNETAGAFSNIIIQFGLSSSIGYLLTFRLLCDDESTYCVEYSDSTLHDILTFKVLVCGTAILAMLGYWRASSIHKMETEPNEETVFSLDV